MEVVASFGVVVEEESPAHAGNRGRRSVTDGQRAARFLLRQAQGPGPASRLEEVPVPVVPPAGIFLEPLRSLEPGPMLGSTGHSWMITGLGL